MGKQYEMAFSIGAKVNGNFGAAFRSAAQSVQGLQITIDQLNKQQRDISSYERTQNAIEKTRQKLELYQQQYANLKAEIDKSSDASAKEKNALLAKGKAIDDQKEKLAQLQEKLRTTGDALQAEGVDLNNLGQASTHAAQQVEKLRAEQEAIVSSSEKTGDAIANTAKDFMDLATAVGAIEIEKKIGQAFKECAEEAINFENSMASVKRTVGGSDQFLDKMSSDFKQMSTEIPITTGELAQIASTAGQLGIAQQDVESFTTVMAKLATTTDLSADVAATMLAQFSNVTGIKDYERLGSTIAQLGDSTATTASKIVEMSQGMAASASLAGMRPTDIMAISAAVGSLGIEAQAGSTAMSQLINNIYKATETGEKLSEFASVAGMSSDQFKHAWGEDAIGTFNTFIQGINDVERNGKSAIAVLDDLGINNVRQTKAILGLAAAGDLLTGTISQANQAWDSNTALDEKAGIMYETTQAKLTMLSNAFSNIKVSIGDAFTPVISGAAEALTDMMGPVADFIGANPALVQGIGAAVGVMAALTAAVTAYTAATKAAAVATAALSSGAKFILGIGAGVAALTGLVVALDGAFRESSIDMEALDSEFVNLNDQIREQQNIVDLCEEYKRLSNEVDHTVDLTKDLQDMDDFDLQLTANADASITPDQFLVDGNTDISIEGTIEHQIHASELVDGYDAVMIHGTPDSGLKLDAEMLVDKDTPVSIHAEWDNMDAMKKDVESLKQEAMKAKKALTNAQDAQTAMEEHLDALLHRRSHAGTQSEKDSLTDQIDTVTEALENNKGQIEELNKKYKEAAGQYLVAAKAMQTITDHSAALAEIDDKLGVSAEAAARGIEKETQAYNELREAKEREAKANIAALRSDLYGNGTTYAKAYAQATQEKKEAQEGYNQTLRDSAIVERYAGQTADQVNARYQYLLQSLNDMQDAGIPDKSRFDAFLSEANDLHNVFNGINADISEISGMNVDWVSNWGGSKTSQESWNQTIADINNGIVEYSSVIDEADHKQKAFLDRMAEGITSGALKPEEASRLITSAFSDEANSAKLVADAMSYVTKASEEMKAAAEGFEGEKTADQQLQPIIDKIENLSKAYTDAYNSAYQSISGQIGLFEQMELPTKKTAKDAQESVDSMAAALDSQAAYLADYQANWEQVKKDGLNEELLKQLSDGSEESAQILSDLVTGGADKIDELNVAFAKVEEGKKSFADSIAEMETDFSSGMEKLSEELTSAVAAMNQSGQAASAATSTVSAFVAAAGAMEGEIKSVFAQLSAAATIKASFSLPSIGLGGLFKGLLGFAGGTPSAQPGYALVGEEGPELVKLRGGERILNADDTEQALSQTHAEPVAALKASAGSGNNYHVDIHNQYDISGSANAEELKSIIEENNKTLREQIESTLEGIQNDNSRMAYA